jgi:hypothetical integral membrane protein (TIGR02206 family)
MSNAFVPFGAAHLAALGAVALLAWALARLARRRGGAATRRWRGALACVAVAAWLAENAVAYRQGWLTWEIGLPLQLCDVALGLAVIALLTLDVRFVEPLCFIGFAGTVPALLWADLAAGFPSFRFLIYFLPHGMVVAVSWMMVIGYGLVPPVGAWWRSFLALNGYAAAITTVNLLLDTNFLYLRGKPTAATPFVREETHEPTRHLPRPRWFLPCPRDDASAVRNGIAAGRHIALPLLRSGRRQARRSHHPDLGQ